MPAHMHAVDCYRCGSAEQHVLKGSGRSWVILQLNMCMVWHAVPCVHNSKGSHLHAMVFVLCSLQAAGCAHCCGDQLPKRAGCSQCLAPNLFCCYGGMGVCGSVGVEVTGWRVEA